MNIYFKATAKFSPTTQRTYQGRDMNWYGYIAWTKLTHIKEVITLDSILKQVIIERDNQLDANFLVWQDYIPDLYTSLSHLLSKLQGKDPATYNLLAVIKEPTKACEKMILEDFDFIGYDLIDIYGDIS